MNPWLIVAALGFLQCFAVAWVLVPLVRDRAEALGLIDRPTLARKQHDRPIPRCGGLGIFPAFWGMLALNIALATLVVPRLGFLPEGIRALAANVGTKTGELEALFLGSFIIFALGLLDDRFNLPPVVRLAVQVMACVPLLMGGVVLKVFLPPVIAWPLTVFWLVLLTNSFNFLDNMNGLTSGVSAIICGVMALIALLAQEWYMFLCFAMLGGAVTGFWRYNFPKASVFLGDSGSTHLGFLLGGLAILSTYYQEGVPTRLPILIPLVVMGLPLFDTISVMWIRWSSGKPLMEGDTNHVSHRLVALGMSRTMAVVFLYGVALATGLAAIPLRNLDVAHGIVQVGVIFLIFFHLHWLERVSYRKSRVANSP